MIRCLASSGDELTMSKLAVFTSTSQREPIREEIRAKKAKALFLLLRFSELRRSRLQGALLDLVPCISRWPRLQYES